MPRGKARKVVFAFFAHPPDFREQSSCGIEPANPAALRGIERGRVRQIIVRRFCKTLPFRSHTPFLLPAAHFFCAAGGSCRSGEMGCGGKSSRSLGENARRCGAKNTAHHSDLSRSRIRGILTIRPGANGLGGNKRWATEDRHGGCVTRSITSPYGLPSWVPLRSQSGFLAFGSINIVRRIQICGAVNKVGGQKHPLPDFQSIPRRHGRPCAGDP